MLKGKRRFLMLLVVMSIIIGSISVSAVTSYAEGEQEISVVSMTASNTSEYILSVTWNESNPNYTITNVNWNYAPPLRAGQRINCKIYLQANSGYKFSSNLNVTLNGAYEINKSEPYGENGWFIDASYQVIDVGTGGGSSADIETGEIEWDLNHPGKITWYRIEDAAAYDVQIYYWRNSGNEREYYKTHTSSRKQEVSIDLCNKIDEIAGRDFYVQVTAKNTKGKQIAILRTPNFESSEFEGPRSFWNNYDHYEEVYDKDVSDNWLIFRYYYERKHSNVNNSYDDDNYYPGSVPGNRYNNGWNLVNGYWYWYQNGTYKTGWVDNKNYYCESNGIMVTGWKEIGNCWYYFYDNGYKARNTWCHVDGKWYYFDEYGIMCTGWLNLWKKTYYLDPSGAMVEGWQRIGNYWYYFFPGDGNMARDYWAPSGRTVYYVNSSGQMATGWIRYTDGTEWYVDPYTGTYTDRR